MIDSPPPGHSVHDMVPKPQKSLLQKRIRSLGRIIVAASLLLIVLWIVLAQPSCHRNPPSNASVDPQVLRTHVDKMAVYFRPRDWLHVENLNETAAYISNYFLKSGAHVSVQAVPSGFQSSQNVIGSFNRRKTPRLIVGAHYDAFHGFPAADDNASGVAVLLELATLFGQMKNPPPVDLIAYTFEEPPHFAGPKMGSAVHAKSLEGREVDYLGVIVLEMVGYYSDEAFSQSYPMPMLYMMYPHRGNFLALVSRWDQGDWIKNVKKAMKSRSDLPVYSLRAPDRIPGIDFSDHRNYWPQNIPALMVTDTAFYRNSNYHSKEDVPESLDYHRMAQVTVSVFEAVNALAEE
ncbi:M28 family peptidase [Kiritimatiellaeota bacterium B1221]|nr:M28 family peptidase [Kiritimatiellaeota bacterium B1221]